MIQLAGSQKSVPLDPDAAEYFTSVDILRDLLVERTKKQVVAMLEKAGALAEEAFVQPVDEPVFEDEAATVLMPDGTRAKVKI